MCASTPILSYRNSLETHGVDKNPMPHLLEEHGSNPRGSQRYFRSLFAT